MLSADFIALPDCGTIRPGFSLLLRICWRQRLKDRVGLALPAFGSYRMAHSKAGFNRLFDESGLPQPAKLLDRRGAAGADRNYSAGCAEAGGLPWCEAAGARICSISEASVA